MGEIEFVALSWVLVSVTVCSATVRAQTARDHPTDAGLQQELNVRSKSGLALGRVPNQPGDQAVLQLRFFDGRSQIVRLKCCVSSGGTVSQNRIVIVDRSSFPGPYSTTTGFPQGFPVAVVDGAGKVIGRSEVQIRASALTLSPGGERFAFLGVPRDRADSDGGVFVAGFLGRQARKLIGVRPSSLARSDPVMRPELDWSPDGKSLLFSFEEKIVILDTQTGESRRMADGGAGRWSPSGDWISYATLKSEPALLNIVTRASKTIDPGK